MKGLQKRDSVFMISMVIHILARLIKKEGK
jgi:hypothetical protein